MYSVADVQGERASSNPRFVQQVADANVRLSVEALKGRSTILKGLSDQGQLGIVGAMHDIGTGRVTFVD